MWKPWVPAKLDEVFDVVSLTQTDATPNLPYHVEGRDNYFSSMCWVSDLEGRHRTLYVHPRPEVMKWLRDQVSSVYGGMMWTITVRETDALVRCVYQSICGYRAVAVIDPGPVLKLTGLPCNSSPTTRPTTSAHTAKPTSALSRRGNATTRPIRTRR